MALRAPHRILLFVSCLITAPQFPFSETDADAMFNKHQRQQNEVSKPSTTEA